MTGTSPTGADYYDAAIGRTTGGATVTLSGASTVPKHVGMHMDVRVYGSEGVIFFANAPARLELRRLDGADEVVPLTDADGEYDGALPARKFAAFCAGEVMANPADAGCGVRVVETLEALYRSAQSGRLEPTGRA